jgi:capsular polysaccharide biosynthesis protein
MLNSRNIGLGGKFVDFISIASVLWKQKWIAIPVVLLVAFAAVYVVKIKPPVYDATSTVLLVPPLNGVTKSQIAAQPRLKDVNADNVFINYGDLDVVANAVIDYVTSSASAVALTEAGSGTAYQIDLSTDFGSPPMIDITGVGSTASAAIKSAQVLTAAVQQDLASLQLTHGVDSFYLITGANIVKPTQAQHSSSAKLRPLVAVLGGGIILLFIIVSSADAAARRRRTRQDDIPLANGHLAHTRDASEALR